METGNKMNFDYEIDGERLNNGFGGRGGIEVIVGSMFSGKTEELMRRLRRAVIARLRVEVFKPDLDTRYSVEDVVSHDRNSLSATPIKNPMSILLLASDAQVVGIDEGQFFDDSLTDVCQQLADNGIRVIVSGLDMDFQRHPFGSMPQLMSIADTVTKVHAVCVECGAPAMYSHRTVADEHQVLLGEKNEYQPLCRSCYLKHYPAVGSVGGD